MAWSTSSDATDSINRFTIVHSPFICAIRPSRHPPNYGNEGIGKPEPLKHGFHGYWSRRITDEHRLVYKIADDDIRIAACRCHYDRRPARDGCLV